jgi:hypothetical protein
MTGRTLFLAGICLLGAGCHAKLAPVDTKLLNPAGTFTLYVSNQSFAISPVDITVTIDGEVVVREYFDVGNQHGWKQFTLDLADGTHTLEVKSDRGAASLSKTFDVSGPRWAVIDYWYYPDSQHGAGPTPRSFSFEIQDTPIAFM